MPWRCMEWDHVNPLAQAAMASTCIQRVGVTIDDWEVIQRRPEMRQMVLSRRMAEAMEETEIWKLELQVLDAIQSAHRKSIGNVGDRAAVWPDCVICMQEAVERWKRMCDRHG